MTVYHKKTNEIPFMSNQMVEPAIAKFKLHDFVRVMDGKGERYKIVALRDYEPCCQVKLSEGNSERLHWMDYRGLGTLR